jgi:hypothetical protein
VRFRSDLRVPVMTFITETDLMIPAYGYLAARQPNTDRLRVWEVAGTSHADLYIAAVGPIDSGTASIADLARAATPSDSAMGMKLSKPMNAALQHHYVEEAALDALNRWVKSGVQPPESPRLQTTDAAPPALALDANGNALGGVRSPWVDAPTARLSGLGQTGAGFAVLFGVTEPYDRAKLDQLYPGGRAQYLKAFDESLQRAVKSGFILKRDEAEIHAIAAAMYPAS